MPYCEVCDQPTTYDVPPYKGRMRLCRECLEETKELDEYDRQLLVGPEGYQDEWSVDDMGVE